MSNTGPELALRSKELWEKIGELRKLIEETQQLVNEMNGIISTFDFDGTLYRAKKKLKLLERLHELLEIEHTIKSNNVNSWKALVQRVQEIIENTLPDNEDEARDRLRSVVIRKAESVLKQIQSSYAEKTNAPRMARAKLDLLMAKIEMIEEEVLRGEGVKG